MLVLSSKVRLSLLPHFAFLGIQSFCDSSLSFISRLQSLACKRIDILKVAQPHKRIPQDLDAIASGSLPLTGITNSQLNSHPPSEPFSIRFDYLTFIVPCHYRHNAIRILDFLSQTMGDRYQLTEGQHMMSGSQSFFGMNQAYFTRGGLAIYSLAHERGTSAKMRVTLPAKEISHLSLVVQWAMMHHLVIEWEAVFTRADLALDDYCWKLPLDKLIQALDVGNFSGFQDESFVCKRRPKSYEGFTQYLGSKKSGKFTRVYDKDHESKGEVSSLRIETVFKHGYVKSLLSSDVFVIIDCDDESILSYCLNAVLGQVDFVDREFGDKNLGRCPRLSWWQEYMDHVKSEPVRVTAQRVRSNIFDSIRWISRQVAPTLAGVRKLLGREMFADFLDYLVGEAQSRIPKVRRLAFDRLAEQLNDGEIGYDQILCAASG